MALIQKSAINRIISDIKQVSTDEFKSNKIYYNHDCDALGVDSYAICRVWGRW